MPRVDDLYAIPLVLSYPVDDLQVILDTWFATFWAPRVMVAGRIALHVRKHRRITGPVDVADPIVLAEIGGGVGAIWVGWPVGQTVENSPL